ncbi:MAG: hypothetical protein IJ438_13270 [Clostridia bacterium]|nr:hypothetical protein [Clostridia bacterium]
MADIMGYVVLIAFAVGVNVFRRWCDRSTVQQLISLLARGESTKSVDMHFMDSTPAQLTYPLTADQLGRIQACCGRETCDVKITPMRPLDMLFGDMYYHVVYNVQGTSLSGGPVSVQEEGYLRVCVKHMRGMYGPCIYWVQGSRTPF